MNQTLYTVEQRPTTIWGLKYEPYVAGPAAMGEGMHAGRGIPAPPPGKNIAHLSDEVAEVLYNLMRQYRNRITTILEIGVGGRRLGVASERRPEDQGPVCSTELFVTEKLSECVYLGVDKAERSYVSQWAPNVHTLQVDSRDQAAVRSELRRLGMDRLDFIFIDGYHDIPTMLNDWRYTDLLAPRGIVAFHDSSTHIGPCTVYDAIDESIFDKTKFDFDWGVAVCVRR